MTTHNGKPDGYTTLTPFLVCSPAVQALSFYEEVFGATPVSRLDGPDGTVSHAELDLGEGRLQVADPSEAYALAAPPKGPRVTSSSISLYVADVDSVFAAAVERGAVVREEPTTFVTGDRYASIFDPYGHRWALLTRVEELDSADAERRLSEWAAQQS